MVTRLDAVTAMGRVRAILEGGFSRIAELSEIGTFPSSTDADNVRVNTLAAILEVSNDYEKTRPLNVPPNPKT